MKRVVVVILLSTVLSSLLFGQQEKNLSAGYYLVVSAYSPRKEKIAIHYVDVLRKEGRDADYGFNPSRNLFFVYLGYYTTLKESLKAMSATRKEGKFTDAWVRVIPGMIGEMSTTPLVTSGVEPSSLPPADSATLVSDFADATEIMPDPVEDSIVIVDNPEIVQYEQMTLGNTEVFLSLYNPRNNRIVDGDVQVIDTERSKLISKVKGNEYLILPNPKSKSGQLTLICESFGYRKVQEEINYPLPLADTVKQHIDLMGTTIVINFEMVRYQKGDIATLYNVYFYNDAAIMLPESKFELNSLLEMMRDDPDYKIRLHGHTNGSYHGKIISMGESKAFFSLTGSKTGVGSSKELSYQRAQIIKDFLSANGIAPERIEIKAWGGKRPLYDKRSVNAKKNVRVEVEILEN